MDAKIIAKQLWADGYFNRSKRLYRLFEYLLSHSLADSSEDLDQYIIATDVLGRSDDFNSYSDSIVRSEISRLRKALAVYNAKQLDYQFIIPTGSYNLEIVPIAETTGANVKTQEPHSKLFTWSRIAVGTIIGLFIIWGLQHFRTDHSQTASNRDCSQTQPNLSLSFDADSLGEGSYAESVIRSISAQYSSIHLASNAKACGDGFAPSYAINVAQKTLTTGDYILLELTALSSKKPIHFERIESEGSSTEHSHFNTDIAQYFTKMLNTNGVIARQAVTEEWGNSDYKTNYVCVQSLYDFIGGAVELSYMKVRRCLEKAADTEAPPLDILGALAQVYAINIFYNVEPSLRDQDKTVNLDNVMNKIGPRWLNSIETTLAQISYVNSNGSSKDTLLLTLDSAITRYPDNWKVLTISAFQYGASLGDWETTLALDNKARLVETVNDSTAHIIRCAYAVTQTDQRDLYEHCQNYYSKIHSTPFPLLLTNAAAYLFNDAALIVETESKLAQINLDDIQERISLIEQRGFYADFHNAFMKAWKKKE